MNKFLVSFEILLDATTESEAENELGAGIAFDTKQKITNFKIVKEANNGDIQTSNK